MSVNHSRTLIVLGMHRSGTSCLTGLLQQAGLTLGEVVEYAPHNKKGNRENLDIRALNDAVLEYSGGAWDRPPDTLKWNSEHVEQRNTIIENHSVARLWGFKDPRSTLTLDFWLEGLQGENVVFLGSFRNPFLVAQSLHSRDPNFSLLEGLPLWQIYNQKLLELQQSHNFPLINYDFQPELYLQHFRAALKQLGLSGLGEVSELDFYDHELKHQQRVDQEIFTDFELLYEQYMPLYQQLERLACPL